MRLTCLTLQDGHEKDGFEVHLDPLSQSDRIALANDPTASHEEKFSIRALLVGDVGVEMMRSIARDESAVADEVVWQLRVQDSQIEELRNDCALNRVLRKLRYTQKVGCVCLSTCAYRGKH